MSFSRSRAFDFGRTSWVGWGLKSRAEGVQHQRREQEGSGFRV